MRRAALITGVGVLVAGLAALFVPFLTQEREVVAETPVPNALVAVTSVEVDEGGRACEEPVIVDPLGEQARFTVGTFGRPGAALELTLRGNGYRYEARIPGGYADNSELRVPVDPPARPVVVEACIRNAGDHPIALYGADEERTVALPRATVDGDRIPADITLRFFRRDRQSILDQVPAMVQEAALFRPAFVGAWLIWTLGALVLLGVPAATLWALDRALREDADGDHRAG